MAEPTQLVVGSEPWALTVPAEREVALKREPVAAPTASPRQLVQNALEKPFHFEALRRALTPDDHVTIVIDPHLPHLSEMLLGVIWYLRSAGIASTAASV